MWGGSIWVRMVLWRLLRAASSASRAREEGPREEMDLDLGSMVRGRRWKWSWSDILAALVGFFSRFRRVISGSLFNDDEDGGLVGKQKRKK